MRAQLPVSASPTTSPPSSLQSDAAADHDSRSGVPPVVTAGVEQARAAQLADAQPAAPPPQPPRLDELPHDVVGLLSQCLPRRDQLTLRCVNRALCAAVSDLVDTLYVDSLVTPQALMATAGTRSSPAPSALGATAMDDADAGARSGASSGAAAAAAADASPPVARPRAAGVLAASSSGSPLHTRGSRALSGSSSAVSPRSTRTASGHAAAPPAATPVDGADVRAERFLSTISMFPYLRTVIVFERFFETALYIVMAQLRDAGSTRVALVFERCMTLDDELLFRVLGRVGHQVRELRLLRCRAITLDVSSAPHNRLAALCPHLEGIVVDGCAAVTGAAVAQHVAALDTLSSLSLTRFTPCSAPADADTTPGVFAWLQSRGPSNVRALRWALPAHSLAAGASQLLQLDRVPALLALCTRLSYLSLSMCIDQHLPWLVALVRALGASHVRLRMLSLTLDRGADDVTGTASSGDMRELAVAELLAFLRSSQCCAALTSVHLSLRGCPMSLVELARALPATVDDLHVTGLDAAHTWTREAVDELALRCPQLLVFMSQVDECELVERIAASLPCLRELHILPCRTMGDVFRTEGAVFVGGDAPRAPAELCSRADVDAMIAQLFAPASGAHRTRSVRLAPVQHLGLLQFRLGRVLPVMARVLDFAALRTCALAWSDSASHVLESAAPFMPLVEHVELIDCTPLAWRTLAACVRSWHNLRELSCADRCASAPDDAFALAEDGPGLLYALAEHCPHVRTLVLDLWVFATVDRAAELAYVPPVSLPGSPAVAAASSMPMRWRAFDSEPLAFPALRRLLVGQPLHDLGVPGDELGAVLAALLSTVKGAPQLQSLSVPLLGGGVCEEVVRAAVATCAGLVSLGLVSGEPADAELDADALLGSWSTSSSAAASRGGDEDMGDGDNDDAMECDVDSVDAREGMDVDGGEDDAGAAVPSQDCAVLASVLQVLVAAGSALPVTLSRVECDDSSAVRAALARVRPDIAVDPVGSEGW